MLNPTRYAQRTSSYSRNRGINNGITLPSTYDEHLLKSIEAKASAKIMRERQSGVMEMMDIVKNYSR